MTDLSFVSLDDLFDEIKRRHDATLLVVLKNPVDQKEDTDIYYAGGSYTAHGLASRAQPTITAQWDSEAPEDEQ